MPVTVQAGSGENGHCAASDRFGHWFFETVDPAVEAILGRPATALGVFIERNVQMAALLPGSGNA
jgi:hypothetical protein